MPPVTSTTDLVVRLRRSGLVPAADLDTYLATLAPELAPRAVLDQMVADRLLTPFQADRLAVGKYKGFLLGGYVILDKIGTGGMGQVFLAEHAAMRRLVAIKVLPAQVVEDPIARERFFREARASAALDHPNIVRVFDLNREGGLPYLVMEFVDGLSLQTLVTQHGAVSVSAAADYARQVALGLQHAHEKGLVHRDIKPGNLLVDRAGLVKILDLGLVRAIEDTDSRLTAQLGGQSILGTADYLAPEQAVDSSSVDVRADIYSLGATLYFLLAGHPMFPEGRTAQKLMWQQWKEPVPIQELRPDIPERLAWVVHTAIAKKPEHRFQSPIELAEELNEWSVGLSPPDSGLIPINPARRGRSGDSNAGGSGVRLRSTERPSSGSYPVVRPATASSSSGSPSSHPVWTSRRPTSPDDTPRTVQATPPPPPRTKPQFTPGTVTPSDPFLVERARVTPEPQLVVRPAARPKRSVRTLLLIGLLGAGLLVAGAAAWALATFVGGL